MHFIFAVFSCQNNLTPEKLVTPSDLNFYYNLPSDKFSDWKGVGQNVARDIAPGVQGEFNATKLVGHWFRQIRLWDPKGVEQFG